MKKYLRIPKVTSLRKAPITSVVANKLVDSNADFFQDYGGIRVGDVAVNLTNAKTATVTAVDSATQLSLSDDIFTTTTFLGYNVPYYITRRDSNDPDLLISISDLWKMEISVGSSWFGSQALNGKFLFNSVNKSGNSEMWYVIPSILDSATTAVGGYRVIDSSADFIAAGVKPGDYVVREGTSVASVVSVDSATQLTLSKGLFNDSTHTYSIYDNETYNTIPNFFEGPVLDAVRSKWNEVVLDTGDFPSNVTVVYTS